MATEKRLIDADAYKSFLCKLCNILLSEEPCEPSDCNILAVIDEQPTVDAVEVAHGHWKYGTRAAVCSECGFERSLDDNFGAAIACPNCGAKMDMEVDK